MEQSLYIEMKRRIDQYAEQGLFRDKEIILFGCNESSGKIMEYLNSKEIPVNMIIDNNPKKIGTMLNGVAVKSPQDHLSPYKENRIILIASRYYPEMVLQLQGLGYQEGTEILKAAEYSSQHANTLTNQEFEERTAIIERGRQVYLALQEDGGELQKLYVCPPEALGDTYVGMSFLRQYNKQYAIERFKIVVRNKAGYKIGYLFGYEELTVSIPTEDMDALLQYGTFSNMADGRMLIMSHRYPYTNRVYQIGNYKGIHFADHFRYSIFELEENAQPEKPYVHRNDETARKYVEDLFTREGLTRGKTVLLMPYANTAVGIPAEFWESLAFNLQEKGYTVCTNSSGELEPAISGTRPLFFDLRYGLEVVEAAGMMIALRSGICDVLSSAKARKIIFYPDQIYGPGKFIDFYRLVTMGLAEEAEEIEWNGEDSESYLTVGTR